MQGFVALGSNLGDRRHNLAAGLRALREAGLDPLAESSVWETAPVDSPSPRWFWNMVIELRTALGPFEVLDRLLAIELAAGRTRTQRNAPRTLDLDLLALGPLVVRHPCLTLPHPRMWQRRFVLEPLCEIAPRLVREDTGRTAIEERDLLRDGPPVVRLGPLAWREEQPV